MKMVNTHEAKTYLSKLLEDVTKGKEVIISKAGTPVAKLVPFAPSLKKRVGGQLKGKMKMSADFDTLPKEFLSHFAK